MSNSEGEPVDDSHQECHTHCAMLLTSQKGLDCIQVTTQKHPLTLHEKNRRCKWLKVNMIDGLSSYYRQRNLYLPDEVWSLIANDLLRCYATINAQASWGREAQCQVDLNQATWYRYTTFEATKYLPTLSNFPQKGSTAIASPAATTKYMYLTENYLGIIEVRLESSRILPRVEVLPGIWWHEIEVDSEVTVESDVSIYPALQKHV